MTEVIEALPPEPASQQPLPGTRRRSSWVPASREGRWRLVLAAQTLAASITSFAYIGRKSFWLDEGYSFVAAHQPLSDLVRLVTHYQLNMAPYYFALHYWLHLGRSEAALRTLSAIPAILAVPVFAVLVDRLLGRRAAVVAGFGLALNTMAVSNAQELRSYSLVMLCVCLSTLLFVEAVHRPRPAVLVGYAVVSGIGTYAHFFAVMVVGIQLLSLAFLPSGRKAFRSLLPALVGYGLLLVPIALFIAYRGTGQINWLQRPTPYDLVKLATVFSGSTVLMLVACLLVVFCLARLARELDAWRSEKSWAFALLTGWLVIPPILIYVVSFKQALWVDRYLIVSLPPFVALVAGGVARLKPIGAYVSTIALLVLLGLLSLFQLYSEPVKHSVDWRAATAYIESHTTGDAPWISCVNPNNQSLFAYYTWKRLLPAVHYVKLTDVDMRSRIRAVDIPVAVLQKHLSQTPRLWVIIVHGRVPGSVANLLRASGFQQEPARHFHRVRVFEYVRA